MSWKVHSLCSDPRVTRSEKVRDLRISRTDLTFLASLLGEWERGENSLENPGLELSMEALSGGPEERAEANLLSLTSSCGRHEINGLCLYG